MFRRVWRRAVVVRGKTGFEIFGEICVSLGRILGRLGLVDEEHGVSWMGHSVLNSNRWKRFKVALRSSLGEELTGGARSAFAKPSSWWRWRESKSLIA